MRLVDHHANEKTSRPPFRNQLVDGQLIFELAAHLSGISVVCRDRGPCLDEYITDLDRAIRTPSPEWQQLDTGDERVQLNANQLQIENEFYSTIRPKRVARTGERPTMALRRGGIEYVELRALDVSPFDPIGINQRQARFLEVFLLNCLLSDSPPIDDDEHAANVGNPTASSFPTSFQSPQHPALKARPW